MRLFVANVGVNSSDAQKRGMRSPLLPDGSFEFVPIKEPSRFRAAVSIPTYRELPSWTGRWSNLGPVVPEAAQTYRAHSDPDFKGLTYGDIGSSRASALSRVRPGDQLWFLARLWEHDGERFTGASTFYFVGRLMVELNLWVESLTVAVPPVFRQRLERNAHWRRWMEGDREPFRALVGELDESCRFERPVRVTPEVARLLFAADVYDAARDRFVRKGEDTSNLNGSPRTMKYFHSITRTIQAFLDSELEAEKPFIAAFEELALEAGIARPPVD